MASGEGEEQRLGWTVSLRMHPTVLPTVFAQSLHLRSGWAYQWVVWWFEAVAMLKIRILGAFEAKFQTAHRVLT